MSHDELWCPVDLRRLPQGIKTDDLRDESVIRSIEDRVNAAVRIDYLANGKLCYVVRMRGSKFPEVFSINSFKMQPDAPALAFPLGLNHEGDHRYGDITDVKHLLLIGATGGGKTTFIHAMLYNLITRNSDQDLELWLIDLKAGAELGRYAALKSSKLNPRGIVRHMAYEPESAIDTLNLGLKEIQRRNGLMRQHSASNLDDLMHITGMQLRRIVMVVDEIAILMLNRNRIGKHSVGSWAENLMTQIASLGRSAGVHLVIATQMIQKEVLSGMILANFENRIAFSVADWRKSQLAIETSEADGLPVGRMIFRREGKTAEYQTCLITPQQTRLEIERIRRHGPTGGLGHQEESNKFIRDAKLLLAVSCERLNGEFSRSKLLQEENIKGVISIHSFNEIARRLEQDGVLEAGKSRQGRRVTRGYFNRPQLLDILYQLNNEPETAISEPAISTRSANAPEVRGSEDLSSAVGHQNGQNQDSDSDRFAVRSLDDSPTCPPEPEDADFPIPDSFKRALDELDEPPKS
ncbi:MAG: hypothetical protein HC828_11355 [Blastochloris sp.]|nr:hypothetical protein [Blastochloris sp.]